MAALDFPQSPVLDQTFVGGNGVQYKWNGSLWVSQGSTTSPGGDFCVINTTDISLPGAGAVIVPTPVITGNAGGWYNTSTGRYTPPAGRYYISCAGAVFNGGGTGGSATINLRKNGVNLNTGNYASTASGSAAYVQSAVEVDANGTDYFEVFGITTASQGMFRPTFMAFPISGLKGPPGDVAGVSGLYIHAGFGAGGITPGTWATAGWTASVNDTGVAPVGNSWTPPAGRWVISANAQLAAPAGSYTGLALGNAGGVTNTQAQTTSAGGTGGFVSVSLHDVIDYNGTTTVTWFVILSAGVGNITAQSWWSAHRIR